MKAEDMGKGAGSKVWAVAVWFEAVDTWFESMVLLSLVVDVSARLLEINFRVSEKNGSVEILVMYTCTGRASFGGLVLEPSYKGEGDSVIRQLDSTAG